MGPQPEGKTDDSEKPDRAAAEQVPYAICDVTATLEIVLNRRGFTKMADGLGYYWHNSPLNA